MRLSQQLQGFLDSRSVTHEHRLSSDDRRLFRSLKAMGERATKGRDIRECEFDIQFKGDVVTLRMVMEGRHAMSVAHQVARRFEDHCELKFAEVVKTKNGAKVVLRPQEKHNENA